MIRRVILSALALTWIVTALPVPSGAATPSDQLVPFVTIASGKTSAIREPAQLVIRDLNAWRGLWRRHASAAQGYAPGVDFAREMVVAIFGGESSEPRRVAVVRIIRDPGRLVVSYMDRETKSPLNGGGLTPQAPFHIVRLARSPLPVAFMRLKTFPPAPLP